MIIWPGRRRRRRSFLGILLSLGIVQARKFVKKYKKRKEMGKLGVGSRIAEGAPRRRQERPAADI